MEFLTRLIEELVDYLSEPDPAPLIANATVHFQDITQQNHCDPQATDRNPCILKCEAACKVTFKFDDPNCSQGYSSTIWSDTCYNNFWNAKLRKKFPMKGCTDYEVWWGTHPLPHGPGYARYINLTKRGKGGKKDMNKGEGDRCYFEVTNCHRLGRRRETQATVPDPTPHGSVSRNSTGESLRSTNPPLTNRASASASTPVMSPDNFENAKDNIKYGVHGCDNFDIYWEDMPFDSGAGLKRHLILEKKAYGDYYKFGVSGCDRKRTTQDFKSCTAGGGSCTGKTESFRSGG
ncbi:unnamed protein product [Fusarium equiseti]|uniref:Uncharacterized protein n=1 Tax=Fusarium equiseti TaxID=61235 RepID=A0A8J2IJL6_FUSEQ|nr:unnamed protein product [Fusarium equiseti]